jgi:hypothetical protein
MSSRSPEDSQSVLAHPDIEDRARGGRKKITVLFADTMELLAEPRRRDALGESHHNQNRMPFV